MGFLVIVLLFVVSVWGVKFYIFYVIVIGFVEKLENYDSGVDVSD